MSIHFHRLRVKEVKRETPDCVSVLFDIPENLRTAFAFKQGQSLTMRTMLDQKEVRRTYSICSSPLDQEWRVAIKKQEGGLFSIYANEILKAGDELEVMEPVGRFHTPLDPAQKKNYLAFAAGSGITPVISIINTTLRTEPHSRFTLVYGNRNKNSIIFKEALEALKDQFIDRFRIIHILSRERMDTPIHSGRISKEKLNDLSRLIVYSDIDEFFLCGPEEMIFCVKDFLLEQNTDPRKIHFELFSVTEQKIKPAKEIKKKEKEGENSRIVIRQDGRSIEFDLPLNSETPILDAALRQGADLPYACKGGMCCTCKAKLVEGKVEMEVHWGLEEEEVEQGYILTCQSHPVTRKVVVDFDIR